jgi:hypothetical protein
MNIKPTLWTTLSFRASCRYGVVHLAGQPVALVRVGPKYKIWSRNGEYLGICYQPSSLRERGGIMRRAEQEYQTRAKPRRR